MRRARLTFPGTFHHCMKRDHGREWILANDKNKTIFLNILADTSIQTPRKKEYFTTCTLRTQRDFGMTTALVQVASLGLIVLSNN